MISTRDLSGLPDLEGFRRLAQSLAMLDAILSPAWDGRTYSFNAQWADGAMMASMRNGSGDHWFALVSEAGVALHGLAHEAPVYRAGKPWPWIFDRLPVAFHSSFLCEPAFETDHSTFCIWRQTGDAAWSCGPLALPAGDDPDGSKKMLSTLSGRVERYVAFAIDCYEVELAPADVATIYQHQTLTEDLVHRLNPAADFAALAADIAEIGYPV